MAVAGIPGQFPNLKLWLKADAGVFQDSALTTAQATNAGGVQGWVDQSGLANNFTQSSAGNKCTYAVNAQNGLPGITFNGTNSYLTATNIPLSNGVTILLAGSVTTSTAGHNTCPVILDNCAVTPASNFGFWAGVAFSSFFLQYQTTNQAANGPPVVDNISPNSYKTTGWNIVAISNQSTLTYSINNQAQSGVGYAYKDSTGVWALGATNAGAQFATMTLGELLVYDGQMNYKAINQLEIYLNQRWNTFNMGFVGAISVNTGYYDARQY